jgi:hypothetical protein
MKTELTSCNGLRSFNGWLQEIGVSDVTGWRWRKNGWIKVHNISGRSYIDQAEIDRFVSRVQGGEFAKRPIVPKPGASKTAPRPARSTLKTRPAADLAVKGGSQ